MDWLYRIEIWFLCIVLGVILWHYQTKDRRKDNSSLEETSDDEDQ